VAQPSAEERNESPLAIFLGAQAMPPFFKVYFVPLPPLCS
jgi:hypothetical protein